VTGTVVLLGAGVPRRRPTGSQADAFGELRDPDPFHPLADLDRNDAVVREDYARLS
jgi:hypothetical protein